jgi:hypothetical protein
MRVTIAVVLCAASFVAGIWLGWQVKDFLAIDRCLDLGGKWDYERGYCISS